MNKEKEQNILQHPFLGKQIQDVDGEKCVC